MSVVIDVDNLITVTSIAPVAAQAATFTGTGLDVSDYIGKLKITQDAQLGTGTSPTWDGKIQDSADNVTFADVSGATFTQVTDSADAVESISVDTRGCEQYIRYVGTLGGSSTPTFAISVTAAGQKQVL